MTKTVRLYLVSTAATLGALGFLLLLFSLWANQDTSTYAAGFTESGFSKVREGIALAEVRRLVGDPLSVQLDPALETWFYFEEEPSRLKKGISVCSPRSVSKVEFGPQGRVVRFSGPRAERLSSMLSREEVLRLLGPPSRELPARAKTLRYSSPGNGGVFRARMLELDENDHVSRIIRYTTHD